MNKFSTYAVDHNHGTKERLVLAVLYRLYAGGYLSLKGLEDLKEEAIFEGKAYQWFNQLKPIYAEEYPFNYATYYSNK